MNAKTIGNALQLHFDKLGVTQVAIAERLGVSKAYVNSLFTGKRPFGKKQAEIWENEFGISRGFLLSGEGEMLKSKPEVEESEILASGPLYEDDVPEQFTSYLVPMAAMGGSLVGFESAGVRRENCERVISPVANADWVVPVCGDSMEPEYPNGSRVYVQQIYPDDFIAWGNVFVLDTTNGIIIKVVKESAKSNCVRCESLNPSGRYTPFDVPRRSIRAMYRVLLCVSVK